MYLGIGRTSLYRLATEGLIKSKLIKTHRGNVSGKRVFLRESLDAYLESLESGGLGKGKSEVDAEPRYPDAFQ